MLVQGPEVEARRQAAGKQHGWRGKTHQRISGAHAAQVSPSKERGGFLEGRKQGKLFPVREDASCSICLLDKGSLARPRQPGDRQTEAPAPAGRDSALREEPGRPCRATPLSGAR